MLLHRTISLDGGQCIRIRKEVAVEFAEAYIRDARTRTFNHASESDILSAAFISILLRCYFGQYPAVNNMLSVHCAVSLLRARRNAFSIILLEVEMFKQIWLGAIIVAAAIVYLPNIATADIEAEDFPGVYGVSREQVLFVLEPKRSVSPFTIPMGEVTIQIRLLMTGVMPSFAGHLSSSRVPDGDTST